LLLAFLISVEYLIDRENTADIPDLQRKKSVVPSPANITPACLR